MYGWQDGRYGAGSWNGESYLAAFPIPPADVGQWLHLVVVYDGTAWRLYRNGKEVAARHSAVGSVPVSGNWAIGANGTGTEHFFQGGIDEVLIFDRALAAGQIQSLYEQQSR